MQLSHLSLIVAALFVVGLTVPTAAVSLEADADGSGPVSLESTSPYATTENGELELDFEKLNDRAVTEEDEVFEITAIDERLESVHFSHEVDGLTFYADGDPSREVDASSPLRLSPGETATVGVAVDTHVAESGRESFTVHARLADEDEGAKIRLTAVEFSATKLEAGENLTVRATYENVGEEAGAARPELTVDGIVVDAQRERIVPGANATITFERTMADPGTFVVGIDDRVATVTVDAPTGPAADIVRTDASLEPRAVEEGEPVAVSVTYENRGEAAGERTVELAVGGAVVDTKTIALEPGESGTVRFEWVPPAVGTYEIVVDGESVGSVTAGEPTPFQVAERVVGSPMTAAVAPPLVFGGLFVAAAANRRQDLWAPWWTAEGE